MRARIPRPESSEYAAAFAGYVGRVGDEDILEALDRQTAEVSAVFGPLSDREASHRYAPGKWSAREMLGHLADTEQVMAYRAMVLARGEAQNLPGFDENAYMVDSPFDARPLRESLQRFAHLRAGNLLTLRQLPAEAWRKVGSVGGNPTSVRALAWIMVGHVRHHLAVLAERYGIG